MYAHRDDAQLDVEQTCRLQIEREMRLVLSHRISEISQVSQHGSRTVSSSQSVASDWTSSRDSERGDLHGGRLPHVLHRIRIDCGVSVTA